MDWDTTELLATVRDRTRIPSTRSGYGDADTLRVATKELHSHVVPLLLAQQEEYLVSSTTIALVEGQSAYRLPARASGGKLRYLEVADSSGDTWPVERRDIDQLTGINLATTRGRPVAYVHEASQVRLYPVPSGVSGWSLKVHFYDRPGRLVLPPEAGTPGAAKVVSVLGAVATISGESSLASGSLTVDLVRGTPAFETIEAGVSASRSGTSLTLPAATAALLSAGDYVCVQGTAPVAQIPPELHPLLALRTALVQLQAKGDSEAAAEIRGELAEAKEPLMRMLVTPRSDGNIHRQRNGRGRWGTRGSWQW